MEIEGMRAVEPIAQASRLPARHERRSSRRGEHHQRTDTGLASGALRSIVRKDNKIDDREFVEVGKWATVD